MYKKKLYLYLKKFNLLKNNFVFSFLKEYLFLISYKEVLLQIFKNRSGFTSLISLYYNKLFLLNKFFHYFSKYFFLFYSINHFPVFKSNLKLILDVNVLHLNIINKYFFFYYYYYYKYYLNIINVSVFSHLLLNNILHLLCFVFFLKKVYFFKKKSVNNLFFFLSNSLFFYKYDKYDIIYHFINSYNFKYIRFNINYTRELTFNSIKSFFDMNYFIQNSINENNKKFYFFILDYYFFYFFFLKFYNKYKFNYNLIILFFFWKESSFYLTNLKKQIEKNLFFFK